MPTKVLVKQQRDYIANLMTGEVLGLTGASFISGSVVHEGGSGQHIDHWNAKTWDDVLRMASVLVLTPQILLNAIPGDDTAEFLHSLHCAKDDVREYSLAAVESRRWTSPS